MGFSRMLVVVWLVRRRLSMSIYIYIHTSEVVQQSLYWNRLFLFLPSLLCSEWVSPSISFLIGRLSVVSLSYYDGEICWRFVR